MNMRWYLLVIFCTLVESLLAFAVVKFYRLPIRIARSVLIIDLITLPLLWLLGSYVYSQTGLMWSQVLLYLVLRFFLTKELLYRIHKDILLHEGAMSLTFFTQLAGLIVGLLLVWLF